MKQRAVLRLATCRAADDVTRERREEENALTPLRAPEDARRAREEYQIYCD